MHQVPCNASNLMDASGMIVCLQHLLGLAGLCLKNAVHSSSCVCSPAGAQELATKVIFASHVHADTQCSFKDGVRQVTLAVHNAAAQNGPGECCVSSSDFTLSHTYLSTLSAEKSVHTRCMCTDRSENTSFAAAGCMRDSAEAALKAVVHCAAESFPASLCSANRSSSDRAVSAPATIPRKLRRALSMAGVSRALRLVFERGKPAAFRSHACLSQKLRALQGTCEVCR